MTDQSWQERISADPKIQFGKPVIKGTRVPVESLFWHLEKGVSLDNFLEDFPSVKKEQAVAVLEIAGKILTSKDIEKLYADGIISLYDSDCRIEQTGDPARRRTRRAVRCPSVS